MERNVVWEAVSVNPEARAALLTQNPCCVWLTGMPCSGKSSLAKALDRNLYERGYHSFMLDGDNVRHGLCSDLGFSAADRTENIRRVGEAAKLMTEAGLVAIVSLVSPFEADRQRARERFAPGRFIEVHVDADLSTCEARDVKGMYAKARQGLIRDFTGIGSPYERPRNPELRLDTNNETMQACTQTLLDLVLQKITG